MSTTTDLVATKAAEHANGTAPPPAAKPTPPAPQYVQGFDGMATAPFDDKVAAVLAAPVNPDEVETKPDGIVFLPGVACRRILTRAFGPGGWALAPRSPARTAGDIVIYHGALYAHGRFISEAVGECKYYASNDGMSYASALEGARTDCLTRCCKDLGIAAELWDKQWRDWWQKEYAVCEWKEAKSGKYAGQKRPHWRRKDQGAATAEPEGRNVGAPPKVGPATQDLEAAMKASLEQIQAQRQKDNADSVLGDATKVPAAPVRAATENGQSTQTPSGQGVNPGADGQAVATSDTGEAPSDEEVTAVRDAIKNLGWAAPKARAWAKRNFGVDSSGALTKDQCASALALLQAAALDDNDDAYAAIYDRLKAAGKVL